MKIRFLIRDKILLLTIIVMVCGVRVVRAQSVYQPYSFQFYQKFSADLYSTQTRIHTSLKPFFVDDSLLKRTYDSLMNIGGSQSAFLNRHLIDTKDSSGNTFYADLLPDLEIGRDLAASKSLWTAGIGAQIGGTVGSKFFYYGSFYYTDAQFPDYVTGFINNTGHIPGQGMDQSPGGSARDWYYSSFLLSYTPIKYINLTLGKDKTFIGDGYRSMLLSDFASNYPFLRATATVGNVRYMAMYAYMTNPTDPTMPYGPSQHKWGYFQYFDWNVSKRISLGFFQNVMEATVGSTGQKQGFNPSLASPFVLLVPLDNINDNPGKNIIGFTGKYKILDKTIIYGQFALNEFQAKNFFAGNGSVTNKSGYQLGLRGADLFGVKGLNYLGEFNTARPYTYASFNQSSNFSQDMQSLADPFAANFREFVGILNYSIGRFDLQGQLNYAYYGLDMNGLDYGQNIFEPYTSAPNQYGNYVGQGLRTDFYYAEGRIAYILNRKYNLRLELGGIYRDETNSQFKNKTGIITVGIKSSFRSIYNDF
ncbi:MAG TPA: hypothetical protein VHE59_20410 [Mucilaginibacter sp.]|nr:hypothetical protein [Mucilaginibacter sp.]